MGLADLPRVNKVMDNKDLSNILAMLVKELEVINGRLDVKNIRAEGIETKNLKASSITTDKINAGAVTADKITVDKLSAITADLGHITAGLVEAIQMVSSVIIGSEIMTRTAGNFPRAQMSSTENMFSAESSTNKFIKMTADNFGEVSLLFKNGIVDGEIRPFNSVLLLNTSSGTGGIQVSSGGNLELYADALDSSKKVFVNSWIRFVNKQSNRTLQQDLDSLQNQINSLQNQIYNLDDRVSDLERP